MSLGKELKALSAYNFGKDEVFKELEPVLKTLANNHQRGCEITFSDINPNTIKGIFEILKDEEISVYDKFEFTNVSKDTAWILVWDVSLIGEKKVKIPSPCSQCCSDTETWTCGGCKKYIKWKESNPRRNQKYIKDNLKCIKVSIKNNCLCIEL